MFGLGEVCPSTMAETICAIFVMIIAAIINNVLLSLFSVYAEELSRKATAL
jgi:hypothetical protein